MGYEKVIKKRSGRISKKLGTAALVICLCAAFSGCQKETSAEGQKKDMSGYKVTDEANEEIKMQNQPISSFWFPKELLEWKAEEDKDLPYNVSSVSLAERVDKEKLEIVNNTQNKDMKVVAITIMNGSTSGNPSQGSNRFAANTFTYWQYIDKLVYWGGSSSEGLIVPPSADVTNAAHKNGVPVLGTVFFPQAAHGGKLEWLNDFLIKDKDGSFPMSDKLIEVARTYGFDGWFINQETEGEKDGMLTEKHAVLMQEFIKECKKKDPQLEIMWYDSMTKDGKMDWQNALTDQNQMFLQDDEKQQVADSMFLNFWWTEDENVSKELLKASSEKALKLGISDKELYAGIDVQAEGVLTPVRWELLEKSQGEYYTSLGLYCPSWTYFSASDLSDFELKEKAFWVNNSGNPAKSDPSVSGWRGISTYAVEKTVVQSYPFETNFSVGNGYSYFKDGEQISLMDWNNRSIADVMPTYRWIIEEEGNNKLTAYIDYANAWNGGNSIKFRGDLEAGKKSVIRMFGADLTLEEKTSFTTTAKTAKPISLDLVLDFSDGSSEVIKESEIPGEEWTTINYDVSKLTGKTIRKISYQAVSKEEVTGIDFYIGNIWIKKDGEVPKSSIQEFTAEEPVFDEDEMYAGVRLSWAEAAEGIQKYEVYRINEDKTKSFLGETVSTNFFVNGLPREEKVLDTVFEVVGVNRNHELGNVMQTKITWPDNSVPKPKMKASVTLAKPGEAITFESISSANTQSVSWEFPGADQETSTENSPVITYSKEGTYNVVLTAKNESGEAKIEMTGLIQITAQAEKGLKNLSEGKSCEATSFVNDNEAPAFAVDGKTETKWCATGTPPHSITIDLGIEATVAQVEIAHAQAGGEGEDMNTLSYSIEVSPDNTNFTEVTSVTKNASVNTVDTFAPVKARYVKVNVKKPTQGSDTAARIYEIQVFGVEK